MAKILLLTPTLHTLGGVENYYNALRLNEYDDRIEYFFVTGGRRETIFALIFRLARNYFRFNRLIATSRYSLIVINPSLNSHSFFRDSIFCWLALRKRKPIIAFFRGWSVALESRIRQRSLARLFFRQSFARVDRFIVLGSSFKAKLIELGCSEDSRFWIESTVADDTFLPEFSLARKLAKRGPFRVLFMSRMVASKGTMTSLHAFRIAQEKRPEQTMELVMAGEGAGLAGLKSVVRTEGISNVLFPGTVSGKEKMQALFDADILLFPTTHDEGMPNVILEAMLYGLPILSRPVGAVPDIVMDETNGFLTESIDPETFADKIVLLATDPELRARIAVENHDSARQNYASDVVRKRILQIFESSMQ